MNSDLKTQLRGYDACAYITRLIAAVESQLKEGAFLGFPYILRADKIDIQAFGEKPITFPRQVLSMCVSPEASKDAPQDVADRAEELLDNCPGRSLGSFTFGAHPTVREDIAKYISQRDNVEAVAENVWITNGVMDGIFVVLAALKVGTNGKPPAALTCIPQYMGYSEILKLHGYYEASYYLDEDNGWDHNIDSMQEVLDECREHSDPRCLILVNPSNPSSTVLSQQQLQGIIYWAHKNHLIILADEVYEHNVHTKEHTFHSVRKVMNAMGPPYAGTPLISFNSISKGFLSEPGLRAGYFEAINLDSVDDAHLKKMANFLLCAMPSQVVLDCLVRPPCHSGPSYELYLKEKTARMDALAERAAITEAKLNSIKGISCGPVMASMSAYARVHMPKKAIEEAERRGKQPDIFYAEKLLKTKGVSVTPGSACGQLPGRFYFRLAFVLPKDKLVELLNRLESFQEEFLETFA